MLPHVPVSAFWELLFLILVVLPVVLLGRLSYRAAPKGSENRYAVVTCLIYALYFAYVILGSQLGWFAKNTFPARILLLGTFPFALLLFAVIWPSKLFRRALQRLTTADLVEVHLFRVLGGFFVVLALLEALPLWFGLIAGIGDVIAAIGSVFVAKALRAKHPAALYWAKAWNLFGFVDILFTAVAANVLTKLALENGTEGVAVLGQFPFLLIPAFAPPTIVFLHLAIFRKLRKL